MIKKLLSFKLMKIALLIVLAAAVVTVFFAYLSQANRMEVVNAMEAADKDGKEEALPEEIFLEAVEVLKGQAEIAGNISQWSEKEQAIMEIGEKLKEILSSDNMKFLANDTFVSDEFSVTIRDYPLLYGTIRRITYTLMDNYNDMPRADTRFFLQYIGETAFFSDVEYLYTDAGTTDENDFQVFENKDGCFALLISSGYEYTTFNSNEKIRKYYATIYVPQANEFHIEQHVEIPLKVASGKDIKLIQQGDIIKGIITGYQNEPECVFNGLELTFELTNGYLESEPVDYDMPGLLLGLSDPEGNIRTLFIRKDDDKVCVGEYAGQIIISRQNKLFSIKPYTLYEDFYENESGDEEAFLTGNIDIKKLLCAPLGVDLTEDFSKVFGSLPSWSIYSLMDVPLYIGNDYICYIQNSYESGGGTFRAGSSNIRFDKLDNLADFTFDGWLSPNFEEIKLADLVYGEKAKDLYKADVSTYGGNLQPYIDFRQLAIKRNLGKWSFMLPITEEYYHPGNGSYYKNITAFAAYDNHVQDFLTTGDEAVELGGWSDWEAKDIFRFPGSNAKLIQQDYFIGIRCGDDNFESYDISIPVNYDEYIVSINFADNDTQKAWLRELNDLNK